MQLTSLIKCAIFSVLAVGLLSTAQAQDKKASPTGTWSWTMPGRNGGPDRKMTLKLKAEGEKLTGKLISPARQNQSQPNETEIKDGKIKGDEVSFTVVREFNGNTMTTKYNGKVSADSIKGKVEFGRDGNTQERDWEAKRQTETK
jgi:hypothetical protein